MKIYLAGGQGYLPACRQIKGRNFGMLISFFDRPCTYIKKMLKALGN